jgi:UPF0176 protein
MSALQPATKLPASAAVLNVSAYKFVPLDALPARREQLLARCLALTLKGTVLLAPEGINLFLAGTADAVDALLASLRSDPLLADLRAKRSWSAAQPFRRMKVKIKREIITLNRPQIRPESERAPAVPPAVLKRWLDAGCDDAGRPLLMLDTRNAFERELGGFNGCVDFGLVRFSDFATALEAQATRFAGQTVVTYCTGGIRCEKAALLMREVGVKHVYQLDGGILDYFEQVGGAHYSGGCFVFDEREALDPALAPQREATLPAQLPAAPFPECPQGRLADPPPVGVKETWRGPAFP